jgi:hypothetical protein
MKKIKYSEIESKIQKDLKLIPYRGHGDSFEFHESTLEIKGDFSLDNTDYVSNKDAIRGYIIDGDLIVKGNIINSDTEQGQVLIVKGNVKANNLIHGGGKIYFYSNADIKLFCTSTYNSGKTYIKSLSCKIFINDEHNTVIHHLKSDIVFGDYSLKKENVSEKILSFFNTYSSINYKFFHDDLSLIFQKSKYYKELSQDIDMEDMIIDEVINGKDKELADFIYSSLINNGFNNQLTS